jgi:predicted nucleic acid-binding Zn ribbon protein
MLDVPVSLLDVVPVTGEETAEAALERAAGLARLADELGAGVVRAVTVRGPSAPSWKKGLLAVRGRGPRDTYG